MKAATVVALDPKQRCAEAVDLEQRLRAYVIGQDPAVEQVVSAMLRYMAGMNAPGRPLSNLLFLGPTGVGKTKMVEAMAQCLHNDEKKFLKIDCAEFQESHSISKLIGAPAGYVGHNETSPFITDEKLKAVESKDMPISIILFDEIEKAHQAFWDLLLGVLDKAQLTISKGTTVDFTRSIIVMTSNLGGQAMTDAMDGSLGFVSGEVTSKHLKSISQKSVSKRFSPEFRNRLDAVVTFAMLGPVELRQILHLELRRVQERILASTKHQAFVFSCSPKAEDFLIREGTDPKFGARHLKRIVEKHVVEPLCHLILSGQVELGDLVRVCPAGCGRECDTCQELAFDKISGDAVAALPEAQWADFRTASG